MITTQSPFYIETQLKDHFLYTYFKKFESDFKFKTILRTI